MTLVRFYCPKHGYLGSFTPGSSVICGERVVGPKRPTKCRKRATTVKPKVAA